MDIVAHEVSNYFRLPYKPTPKQLLFHTTVAQYRLFGGAASGGKSYALRWEGYAQCLAIPRWTALLLRRTSKMLEDNHISKVRSEMPAELATYNEQDSVLTFFNGSIMRFGHLQTEAHLHGYLGSEWGAILPDELTTTLNFKEFTFLTSRNRNVNGRPNFAAATNPGGPGHCVPHGDVLTPSGWRDIRTMQVGDPVFTVTEAGRMVETRVAQVHSEFYTGPMVEVRARGFSMTCTPNHRVAKTGGKSGHGRPRDEHRLFSLRTFDSLPGQATILRSVGWVGQHIDTVEIPFTGRKPCVAQPLLVNGDLFFEFMGWFLSEGSAAPPTNKHYVGIAQTKPEGRVEIMRILGAMGIRFKTSRTSIMFSSRSWADFLKPLGKCREKHVPQWMKNASSGQLALLMRGLMSGDGHYAGPTSGTYYTISRQLADDFCEIALKLGYVVSTHERSRENRSGISYAVNFKVTRSGGTELLTGNHIYSVKTATRRRSDVRREPFSGPVYCIGIEGTHSFVIKQNGSVWVSGNSFCKSLWIDKKPFDGWPATGYNPDDFAYIPATIYDNKHLMEANPEYETILKNLPENLRAAYLDGSWDLVSGQYFDCWNLSQHVDFSDRVESPPWCERNIGIDWGFSHNSAVEWGVTDERAETLTVYRELVAPRMTPEQLGESIVALTPQSERSRIANIYLSHDAHELRKEEFSIADQLGAVLAKNGLPWPQNARSSRVAGWVHMYEMLRAGQLKIHKSCQNLIGMMPELQRDPDCSDDVLKVDGDDAPDALRYLIQNRWGTGNPPFEVQVGRNFAALEETHGKAKDMNQVYIRHLMAKAQARKSPDRPFSLDRGGPKARGRRAGAWRFGR